VNLTDKIYFRNEKGNPEREASLTDYDIYIMSVKQRVIYVFIAAAVIYFIAYVFYRNHIISALLSSLAFFYPKVKVKEIIKKRKSELNIQFKDMLYSLSSSLSAGKSVETAFKDTLKDLEILYPNPHTDILKEVGYIVKRIELNETIESALSDFAARARIEDIGNFADVFYTCKRAGGNMVQVIYNATSIINDKIEIRQEIDTLLAERRFEQKVLNILPVIMVVLLSATAEDYIKPVFDSIPGRIVMSISILLLSAAFLLSRRIMNIKV